MQSSEITFRRSLIPSYIANKNSLGPAKLLELHITKYSFISKDSEKDGKQ